MASYYMNGYTPPEGVNSASKVKEYQRRLGVKVDGVWGPDTDAAYRASIAQTNPNSGGFTWGTPEVNTGNQDRSYVQGDYILPEGVDSRDRVKEYQRILGVKVDGIWGPDTDAAYRAWLTKQQTPSTPNTQNTGGFTWGDSGRDNLFDAYFEAIKKSLTLPEITIETPSKEEVSAMWSDILRPGVDAAIDKRNRDAERDMAELDADAVSRGMGSSTFITSVKAREMEEAQDDISDMEAQYGAVLAERIFNTLSQYDQMKFSAQQYNADAAESAIRTALSMASDWYSQYLSQQAAAQKQNTSGSPGSGGSSGSSGSGKKSGLSAADYTEYIRNLTPAQQKLLFTSTNEYWSSRRDEIYSVLGSTLYENLKKQYGGK